MFLDISKFSQWPAWTEQEQDILLRVLSLFFTEMIRIVEDFGGVVEKNTGDGLMAYFVKDPGDTVAVQQRALSARMATSTSLTRGRVNFPRLTERCGCELRAFGPAMTGCRVFTRWPRC
jgi:class 3 adenylate cyclase